jgi:hypothetical protein
MRKQQDEMTTSPSDTDQTHSTFTLSGKDIMGWLEFVSIMPEGILLKAKLDTGAKTSSLHATEMTYFRRSGSDWVRFRLTVPHHLLDLGHPVLSYVIERPVFRTTRIKRHQAGSIQRTVIVLPVQLGRHVMDAEFTLTDRSHFNYPVLLGRRFLENIALVDPGATYLLSASQQPLVEDQQSIQHTGLDHIPMRSRKMNHGQP